MVHADLVCGYVHFQDTQCKDNVHIKYHSVCAVISCIYCTQLWSDLEVVVLVYEIFIEYNLRLFYRGIYFHSLYAST